MKQRFSKIKELLKCMPYTELIDEHERLVKDLKEHGSKEELEEQSKELAQYKKEFKRRQK